MPSWDPTPDQVENMYDRHIDRADGETPLQHRCPGCHVIASDYSEHLDSCPYQGRNALPRPALGAIDPREGYDLGNPKGWLL